MELNEVSEKPSMIYKMHFCYCRLQFCRIPYLHQKMCQRSQSLGILEIIPADSHLQVWDGGDAFYQTGFLVLPLLQSFCLFHSCSSGCGFFSSVLPIEAPFPSTVRILCICLSNTHAINEQLFASGRQLCVLPQNIIIESFTLEKTSKMVDSNH